MNPDMRKITVTMVLLAAIMAAGFANPARADGLAMHGTPKYGSDASHLDYANPDAPKGGALRQAGIGTFDTLNPFSIKGKPAEGLNYVYDRLMGRVWDEPFTLYPLIAQRADVPEDRSSVTFHLDPRAQFNDHTPITADDVMFSYETLKTAGRPNMRRVYALATTAEKIDDQTVRFVFGPGHDRETVMIFAMMPVLSKAWWSTHTFDATSLDIPLCSGPYKITAVDPGRKITYERVKDYWAADLLVNKGLFNFDTLTYEYFRDDMVALEAFKAGNLDLRREWDAGRWASSYDFPAVRNGDIRLETLRHNRAERTRGLIFNTRRAPFDNLDVRRALSQALDFEWVNHNLFRDQYNQVRSLYPNTDLAATGEPSAAELALLEPYRATLPPDTFGPAWAPPKSSSPSDVRVNLRRADQLLNDAGWVVKDGIRVNAETGKPFVFDIILSAPEDEKVALAYTRTLKRLGIEANVRLTDSAGFIRRLNDYDYDMVLYYWQNSLSPGTEQMLYWSCEAAKQPARFNYAGICDPAVDALAAAIPNARTRADLTALTRALDRVVMNGYYFIPLNYAGKDFMASRHNIQHPQVTPLYGVVLETWWTQ